MQQPKKGRNLAQFRQTRALGEVSGQLSMAGVREERKGRRELMSIVPLLQLPHGRSDFIRLFF